jgi:hypothetical protein
MPLRRLLKKLKSLGFARRTTLGEIPLLERKEARHKAKRHALIVQKNSLQVIKKLSPFKKIEAKEKK